MHGISVFRTRRSNYLRSIAVTGCGNKFLLADRAGLSGNAACRSSRSVSLCRNEDLSAINAKLRFRAGGFGTRKMSESRSKLFRADLAFLSRAAGCRRTGSMSLCGCFAVCVCITAVKTAMGCIALFRACGSRYGRLIVMACCRLDFNTANGAYLIACAGCSGTRSMTLGRNNGLAFGIAAA